MAVLVQFGTRECCPQIQGAEMEAPPPHKYGTGSRSDRVWLITNLLTSAAVVCVVT